VLLEVGRPREAIAPFEQALRRNANRSLSVIGLARAAAAVGDEPTKRRHYEQLLANYNGADADRPELAEAKANLDKGREPAASPLNRLIAIALAGSVLVVIAALWMRRRAKLSERVTGKAGSSRRTRTGRPGR
jgi:hypothetical protein